LSFGSSGAYGSAAETSCFAYSKDLGHLDSVQVLGRTLLRIKFVPLSMKGIETTKPIV
jgi:hypothetical protein